MKIVSRSYKGTKCVETPLPEHLDIVFGEGQSEIAICVRNDRLEVRALHGYIMVLPQVSNSIEVKAVPFTAS